MTQFLMPPLESAHYIPAFGFMLLIGGGLVTAVKVLYNRNQFLHDCIREIQGTQGIENARVIQANSTALKDSTDAMEKLAGNVMPNVRQPRGR